MLSKELLVAISRSNKAWICLIVLAGRDVVNRERKEDFECDEILSFRHCQKIGSIGCLRWPISSKRRIAYSPCLGAISTDSTKYGIKLSPFPFLLFLLLSHFTQ